MLVFANCGIVCRKAFSEGGCQDTDRVGYVLFDAISAISIVTPFREKRVLELEKPYCRQKTGVKSDQSGKFRSHKHLA